MASSAQLQGQVAIVTGASRGIGREIALRLAREGAALVLNCRHADDALREVEARCAALGVSVATVKADVGDPAAAGEVCAQALSRFGRIDVLVNNAGTVVEELLVTLPDEAVRAMIDTNVLGTVWMTRAALPSMLRCRAGCIVNLSSALAGRPGRGSAVYAGTKGFVESFTRAVAVEVARKGVRVNAVAPGVIVTSMTAGVRATAEQEVLSRIGARRFGEPQDVAALVAFLVSPEANYINGAVIGVDGAFVGGT